MHSIGYILPLLLHQFLLLIIKLLEQWQPHQVVHVYRSILHRLAIPLAILLKYLFQLCHQLIITLERRYIKQSPKVVVDLSERQSEDYSTHYFLRHPRYSLAVDELPSAILQLHWSYLCWKELFQNHWRPYDYRFLLHLHYTLLDLTHSLTP